MLVLTRKSQQQIQIGPHVTITILQVKGQSVRIGIEAPREVSVLRVELAKKLANDSTAPMTVAASKTSQREPRAAVNERRTSAGNDESSPLGGFVADHRATRCRAPRAEIPVPSLSRKHAGTASLAAGLGPSAVISRDPVLR